MGLVAVTREAILSAKQNLAPGNLQGIPVATTQAYRRFLIFRPARLSFPHTRYLSTVPYLPQTTTHTHTLQLGLYARSGSKITLQVEAESGRKVVLTFNKLQAKVRPQQASCSCNKCAIIIMSRLHLPLTAKQKKYT